MSTTGDSRSPLDQEPKRIEFSNEEQWFVYRVLRGHLRERSEDGTVGSQPVAAALGKVEAGVSAFTLREAHRIEEAVLDYARDASVSFSELALSMVVLERIERSFDLPDPD